MQTTLTGYLDDEMIEEIMKAAQRSRGKEVKVTIEEPVEPKPRGRRNGAT